MYIIVRSREELDRCFTCYVYPLSLSLIKDPMIMGRYIYLITHTNVDNMNEAYDIVWAEICKIQHI